MGRQYGTRPGCTLIPRWCHCECRWKWVSRDGSDYSWSYSFKLITIQSNTDRDRKQKLFGNKSQRNIRKLDGKCHWIALHLMSLSIELDFNRIFRLGGDLNWLDLIELASILMDKHASCGSISAPALSVDNELYTARDLSNSAPH